METLLTGMESRIRGRPAVYDASNLARALARRYLGARLSRDSSRRAGALMRWSYGPTWGVLLGLVMGTRTRGPVWPLWGLGLGAGVLAFEMIMLPATGATPPVSSWHRDELNLEVLNTMAFGTAVAAFLQAVSRRRMPAPVTRWRSGSPGAG